MLPRHALSTLQALARAAFAHLPYVNLEDPDTRELALADPRRFLSRLAQGAVLDEIQRAPQLTSSLLGLADSAPAMGRWVLTGSQHVGLMDGLGQSLAGRVGMLTLLPLAHAELPAAVSLEERLWHGGYPALNAAHRELQPAHWFAS